jgi:hypothetical protein
MSAQPLQPLQPVGVVLLRTLAFYSRHVRLVLLITLPVVAFVDVVLAAGLGELTASVHKAIPTADGYLVLAASEFVTIPLVTAMLARAVIIDLSGDQPPRARDVVLQGLDLFAPAFVAVLLFVSGVLIGFFLLVIPGIYLAVSWYFVVQATVVDGARGMATINTSTALVRGRWWHSAGVGLCFQLAVGIPSLVTADVFESLARTANSDALIVIGNVLIDTIALPFVAIGATLYYLELRQLAGLSTSR